MNAGRIEQAGTPEDVYLRPSTRFVAGFLGRGELDRQRLGVLPGSAATGRLMPKMAIPTARRL